MTREAAIERLNALKQFIGYDKDSEIVKATQKSLDMAIKALEQEPTAKNDLAQERYQDLKEYFGDKETAKTILEDEKEFKAWLERVKWHVKKADELARELEALKQEPILDKIRAEIAEYGSIMVTYAITDDTKTDKGIEKLVSDVLQQAKEEVLQIIDKHKAESEDK